jgi:hypothetical protein
MPTASITIPAGESLSSALDLTTGSLAQLLSPDVWSPPANISFMLSADGASFQDVYDETGNEIVWAMDAGRAVAIDPVLTSAATFLKLRSGSSTHPIAQDADRTFVCVMV